MTADPKVEPQYQNAIDLMEEMGYQRMGWYSSWSYHDDPRRLVFMFARYKFVAKMLQGTARVLEVGCADAFASRIVRQSVDALTVVDVDPRFLASARETMSQRWPMDIIQHDAALAPVPGVFDAVYSLDTLEHVPVEDEDRFIANVTAPLVAGPGVAIFGMPSLQSQQYASAHSRVGHVNCKDQPDFKKTMLRHFETVFMFSMNDEVVHTGHHAMAHYSFALCVGLRCRKPRYGEPSCSPIP